MFKFAPEGYPYFIVFALLIIIAAVFGKPWMIIVPFALLLFMFFFFRDPDRIILQDKGIFVSPADGRVILIQNVNEDIISSYLPLAKPWLVEGDEGGFIKISIFMSPFNVHVNRAPCDGVVKMVRHTPGRFSAANKDEASMLNENIAMLLEGDEGRILVRQVAGFIARRAVCRVKEGDILQKGQKFGIIKFSSRLDVFLPINTEVRVKLGDKVKAGESILGMIKN
ncbi:MAG: phosphatidylserine decarboxylase family protein [Nitrospirae bacterium]|nr:phosphatidylserine decarboxylase family protein [Nitrospirota bacterium]